MQTDIKRFKNSRESKMVFFLSILTSVYWCVGKLLDTNTFAFAGAVFEFLWLPMLAALIILPILSFIHLIKAKFNTRSLYLYSILVIIPAFLIMLLR